MERCIYGIDVSKNVTPVMVRDAIFRCFLQAHKEILDQTEDKTEWDSEEEKDKFREVEIKIIVENAFKKANVDYGNPSKEGLIKVIDNLAEFASRFRKPEIIKKHYDEIMVLIDKLD